MIHPFHIGRYLFPKEAFLVPIIDWKSGRVQIKAWLRWR